MRFTRAGTTLIELLVALFLFVATFLSLLGLIARGREASRQGRDTLIATGLARELLEAARVTPLASLVSLPEREVAVPVQVDSRSERLLFSRRLRVETVLSGRARWVSAWVGWRVGGQLHQVELVTYVGP